MKVRKSDYHQIWDTYVRTEAQQIQLNAVLQQYGAPPPNITLAVLFARKPSQIHLLRDIVQKAGRQEYST